MFNLSKATNIHENLMLLPNLLLQPKSLSKIPQLRSKIQKSLMKQFLHAFIL